MFEKTIETENLIIRDSNGKIRIEMKIDDYNDPKINIYPKEPSLPLIQIGMDDDKPSVQLFAKNSLYQNTFNITQIDDHFSLEFGTGMTLRIKIGFNNEGDPILCFFDYETQSVKLGLILKQENGTAGLVIFDNDGNQYDFPH